VDVVWLRNPLPDLLLNHPRCSILASVDQLRFSAAEVASCGGRNGCDPLWMNTGFLFFRHSNATLRTVEAFLKWNRDNAANGLTPHALRAALTPVYTPKHKRANKLRRSKQLASVDDQVRWKLFRESLRGVPKVPGGQRPADAARREGGAAGGAEGGGNGEGPRGGASGGECLVFVDEVADVALSVATLSPQYYMNYHHWNNMRVFSDEVGVSCTPTQ